MSIEFPATAIPGQIFPANNGVSYQWDGAKWTTQLRASYANEGANPGPNPPANPSDGTFWWDTKSGQLFTYYIDDDSEQWVEASTPHDPIFEPNPALKTIGDTTMAGSTTPTVNSGSLYSVSFDGDADDVSYEWSTEKSGITNIPSLFTNGAVTGNVYSLLDNDNNTFIEMAGDANDEFTISFSEPITGIDRIVVRFSAGNANNVRWNVKPNGSYNFQGNTSSQTGEWFSIPLQEDIQNIRFIKLSDETTVLKVHGIGFTASDEGIYLPPPDLLSNKFAAEPTITFNSVGTNKVSVTLTSLSSFDSPKTDNIDVTVGS